ncbi:cobalamin-binding protein [Massilia sp. R2A-15]|uniref:cobalamin-binding protein n=1 Tax=Massilia sp. R2A-15 TaxID=3064278 RepID=UPI0027335872|nr:cobalamin-binding protein [Massilia sp. R2A-15]WLI90196.1 cobalamin-binding protein [Massilia sp. R2A-15]
MGAAVGIAAALLCAPLLASAAITVVDDAGRAVTLAAPAQRIVSMAPHVTELLFAAGGGERIVGAINFSDYPEAAKKIPLVGSNAQIDMERVIALKPDLLVVWQSGNTGRQLEQLGKLGIPVFYSEPHKLDQVADSLTRFGRLLGTEKAAASSAAQYRASIASLGARYARRPPVRVFYQIWDKPLYTLSGKHIIDDAIRLCGGRNIFADLNVVAPSVSTEAVLQANPEAIVGGDQHEPDDAGIAIWKPYRSLLAVERGNLFRLEGELLTRPGPRMAQGVAQLCEKIELARQRRK